MAKDDREVRESLMRGAALAEHVHVDVEASSAEERHIVFGDRRVGKAVWNRAEEHWDLLFATTEGYVHGRLRADSDELEVIDRHFSGDVAHALASGRHPLSKELL